jgi:tRNA dimethylallyltransferase
MKKTVICLIGPTAVGKTDIALRLAKRIDAEIISCDSMQVYKEIDIATSKPTKGQRKSIPHHIIDVVNPCQEYNAARFRKTSQKIINDIHNRGKVPLLVAGTGLYLKALLDGLFKGPGQNVPLRKKLYHQAEKYGPAYCYRRLERLDPQAAGAIHPHDLRRIIRALEVYELTGQTITELKEKTKGLRNRFNLHIIGLIRKRDQLYERIEKRVERMFNQGLVKEIRRLSRRKLSRTAQSLLGYKEISGFLKGEYPLEEAKRLLKLNTRHYAKRQLTWFRKEKGVRWIEVDPGDTPQLVVKKILTLLPENVGNRKR